MASAVRSLAVALAALFCVVLPPQSAVAEALRGQKALAALTRLVDKAPVMRAEFQQARMSKALSQPLRSSGRLVATDTRGLLWQLDKPFALTIAITPTQLIEREPGSPPRVTPLTSQPMFAVFSDLFLGLLSGKTAGVEKSFDVRMERNGNAWTMALTPKDSMLRRAISTIQVTGGRYVETVVVAEQSGDKTEIRFTNQRTVPPTLTDAERQAFGG